jgi:uncharacterized protein YprB with RNaseH-like and TPR domain
MEDLRQQLEELKKRIARIDAHYASPPPPAMPPPEGRAVTTPAGEHWEMERQWPAHHRHGSSDVGALSELPADLLAVLAEEPDWASAPTRWLFLDTETTGLAGGSGTVAFLVGVGAITGRGFELKQFFIRDYGEEPSMLDALTGWLEPYDVLVTYNGRAYDVPLLETRYRLHRRRPPFDGLRHIDLLYAARRLWRLALDSRRLVDLEARILGVERVGDVGGALIPNLYFEYLRTRNIRPLLPVFTHNAFDILSLACLTAVVPAAFRDPSRLKSAAEMVGLGRWLRSEGRQEEALALFREALHHPVAEPLLWETLWQAADLERKLGRHHAAVALWSELSTVENPFRAQAYERLAIHYEHREKNAAMALEMTRAARALVDSEALQRREQRLQSRASSPKPGRLM